MQARWLSSWLPPVGHLVAVSIISALATWSGLELTVTVGGDLAALWLTNGILLAILLTRPPRQWAALLAAGLAANIAVDLWFLYTPLESFMIEGCNGLEVLLAALLLRHFLGASPDLSLLGNLIAFALFGVCLAPACSALLAGPLLASAWQTSIRQIFFRWYLGDALGLAVMTPLALSVLRGDLISLPRPLALARASGFAAGYLLVTAAVFAQSRFPLLFLPFPLLLLAVRRLGFAGAALLMVPTAVIAFGATATGHGPATLMAAVSAEQRLALVQVYVSVTCITAYLIGVGVAERWRLGQALADKHADLARSERLYRLLADNSSDIIVHSSGDARLYVSPSAQEVLGWSAEEMTRPDWKSQVHPDDLPAFLSIRDRLAEGATTAGATYRYRRSDGSWACLEGRSHIIDRPAGGEMEFVTNVRDVTRQKDAELALESVMAELAMQAATDPLTGIANRRCFEESLEKEWRRGMRIADPLSLLLIDVDHFKAFNDLYGHQAGDDCLRFVASTIAYFIRRPHDVVARYGGEEFIVMLPATTVDGAERIAESIRAMVADRAVPHASGAGGVLAVSIGVACIAPHADNTPSALIEAADAALYAAKRSGRNQVAVAGAGKDAPIGGEAAVA